MSATIRRPAVAGYFYSAEREQLLEEIERCFLDQKIGPASSILKEHPAVISKPFTRQVEVIIVPHAGYTYSGAIAAHSYNAISQFLTNKREENPTVIILGPNHYGIGSGISISSSSKWETPLGIAEVDQEISNQILSKSKIIDFDNLSHSREHSIEVQIPFLQAIQPRLYIVPICLMLQDMETIKEVSDSITKVIRSNKIKSKTFLIVASSDLTHYEAQETAYSQDRKLLDKIGTLDLTQYYSVLERNNVTACGYGAIGVAMSIAKSSGMTSGKILRYATSGDVTGDTESVVGYAAVRFV